MGALHYIWHRLISLAALAVPAISGACPAAAEYLAHYVGRHHLPITWLSRLGLARSNHPRGNTNPNQCGLPAASSRQRRLRLSPFLASFAAQSAADSSGPILDFSPSIYPERSQSGF